MTTKICDNCGCEFELLARDNKGYVDEVRQQLDEFCSRSIEYINKIEKPVPKGCISCRSADEECFTKNKFDVALKFSLTNPVNGVTLVICPKCAARFAEQMARRLRALARDIKILDPPKKRPKRYRGKNKNLVEGNKRKFK